MSSSSPRLLLLGLALLVVLVGYQVHAGGSLAGLPMHDFVEYWAAGRLLLAGENPYDPERVHELERQAGRTDEGILMWNPPWSLPFVAPFALLSVRSAHVAWLVINLGIIVLSCVLLWGRYGPQAPVLIALVIACTFQPTWFALLAGQISPLLLLGATLFLLCVERKWDLAAGAATTLLAIKPHLGYLFWLALLLWAVQQRRWRVLAGGAGAGVVLVAIAAAFDPLVLGHYWHTLTSQPPAQYRSPTLGTLIRMALDGGSFRWQFLALLPGLAWFARFWLRHRDAWNWGDRLPLLLLVSILTTAYGGWPFDLVLLLVPVLHLAAGLAAAPLRQRLVGVGVYVLGNALALWMMLCGVEYLGFIWITPLVLFAYLSLGHAPVHEPAPRPQPA
jgi:hypothetical protein